MLSTLISAAVPIVGSLIGGQANRQAASTAANAQAQAAQIQADSNREARQEFRAAADRGIGAIQAGTGRYAETIAPLLTPRPVALRTYRGLTDAQRIGREDTLRQGRATLAASGLRGAGRAGVAAIMDADQRYIANAVDRNDAENRQEMRRAQGSADSARSGLASVYAQEGGAIANTEIGAGNRIGENIARDGAQQGNAVATGGTYQAQAQTANGALWGDAIGALGSVIADASKQANWDRYRSSGGSI